jgi:hypothetical protein
MTYIDLQKLSGGEFKRLCGVSRDTFSEMVEVLRPQLERLGQRGGQNKLQRRRPTASNVGVLARVSQPVSDRHELEVTRDNGGTNCQKS